MILRCEIKLKLGDAWTAYDRMGTADVLIKKIRNLLNHDCEKSKGLLINNMYKINDSTD